MAKAALENAMWDLEAQREASLAQLLGGMREPSPAVSPSASSPRWRADGEDRAELAAGYQRIKLKCRPGWDMEVFEEVRKRWPDIMLSVDANSAYRVKDSNTW